MTQRELERKISQAYGEAKSNIEKETAQHFESFQKEDKKKQEQLKNKEITKDEYNKWLTNEKVKMSRDKELLKAVTYEYNNADKTAEKWINGELPYSYVAGYNETGRGIQGEVDGYSFSLIDKNAVKSMMADGDIPIATYTAGTEKHQRYVDKKARQAIQQGIIQGDSVNDVEKKVNNALGVVSDKERKATIRNTRTLMNSAHNSGRYEAMETATEDGIILDKQWLATKDERTRDSHAFLDGEIVKLDEDFSNGLRFPQDPTGEAGEVYNCRCSMREVVRGFYNKYTGKTEMLSDIPQEEYAERSQEYWQNYFAEKEVEKETQERIEEQKYKVVDGKDILGTWQRRPDEFEFAINDVMAAQGFDGLPRIVSAEEFDKYVKQANNGEGFVAQRTYSAPDQETLDLYRDQLYHGQWYVDCGTGGAQYGQGMYCAADYTGQITDGMKAEMEHYAEIGRDRFDDPEQVKIIEKERDRQELELDRKLNSGEITSDDYWKQTAELNNLSNKEFAERYVPDIDYKETQNYVETMTLDPSAKVISYKDLDEMRSYSSIEQHIIDSSDYSASDKEHLRKWVEEEGDTSVLPSHLVSEAESIETQADKLMEMDAGTFAASMGYDAINAEGHGKSDSYTVILNRTKVIIKEP